MRPCCRTALTPGFGGDVDGVGAASVARAQLRVESYRDIGPEDLDPGMDGNPRGVWTKVVKPRC